MPLPARVAIVPAMEIAELDAAPCDGSSHTHAIGSVGFTSFMTDMRMKIPNIEESTRLMNIKNCRSHRKTQSLLKSLTSASRVARCVDVDSSDSIQMMKKW